MSIAIYHAKGITTVYSPDGKVLIRADDSKAKKIPVPAGKVVPATYIYQDVLRSEITSFSFTTEKGEALLRRREKRSQLKKQRKSMEKKENSCIS